MKTQFIFLTTQRPKLSFQVNGILWMQWFRPLQTPRYKIYSGEASDAKDTVMFHLYVSHVPSFSKRDEFAVSSEIIVVFSLGTHYSQGYIFLLHNSHTCWWEFCRDMERRPTNLSLLTPAPPQKKTGVSRASYYYAPIQIKPNRVKALSLCGIIVQ